MLDHHDTTVGCDLHHVMCEGADLNRRCQPAVQDGRPRRRDVAWRVAGFEADVFRTNTDVDRGPAEIAPRDHRQLLAIVRVERLKILTEGVA